jgi:hypothetical protein
MAVSKEISEHFTVVFHNVDPSEAVLVRARQLLGKLLTYFPSIMRGTMTIEGRHHHHHQGNLYHVALRVHVPRGDVVVSHDPERNHAHEDLYVAMRDTCEAARKQLSCALSQGRGAGLRHERSRFEGNPRNSSAWGEGSQEG